MSIIPVILSGGAGTRLWPVSREGHPKPFMRLPDGHTLLARTYRRAAALLPSGGSIMTVTNREHYFASKDQLAEAGVVNQQAHYLLEPEGRNTAAAVAHAALALSASHGEETLLVIMAADHLIDDDAAFCRTMEHATLLAREGFLVTCGVPPTRAETGFGYIQGGEPLDDRGGCRVKRFVEKPDHATAQEYLRHGGFLWNAGIFCFKIATLLAELRLHAPEILAAAEHCLSQSPAHESAGVLLQELHPTSFCQLPDISIDYALLEHSERVAMIPAGFDWSDIGSWTALADLIPGDQHNNRVDGDALLEDTSNTFILSDKRLVATVGVQDLIIVDTCDAVLVAHANRAQDIGRIAKRLKHEKHPAYQLHRTVGRPWGNYTVLEEGPRFKIKRILVKPGASLSLQMHHHRSEHWIVVQGAAEILNGSDKPRLININESTFIPAGHRHRLSNPGLVDLVIIEVQSGEYLGEDDIVRLDDQYGRVS